MKNLPSSFDHWTIFSVLATLNILDASSTTILIIKFGSWVEANPIMRYAITLYGVYGLWMIKFAVLSFFGLVIFWIVEYYKEHRAVTLVRRSMIVLCALLLLVVINNTILVIKTINI